MNLEKLGIEDSYKLLKKKEITSYELVSATLKNIEEKEKDINAYLYINKEGALEAAREADKKIAKNEQSMLCGIPISIKDLICTKGIKTTCASKILENFYPPYNATVIEKLKKENFVLIGKCNMDEFAMGSSTENSAFKKTANPHDLTRVPGGSSGGSTASVAAHMASSSLGSDTGGSIRQPAAFCGVVGLKPSYGRVSRFGLIAFASSFDQIGPITKNTRDAAILANAICGFDEKDSTSSKQDVPNFLEHATEKSLKNKKIGIVKEFSNIEGVDKEIEENFQKSIECFKSLGAQIVEVSLKHINYGLSAYYIIAPSEASSNLGRYDGVKYGLREKNYTNLEEMYCNTRNAGFGDEVKRRIIIGTYALSAGYYDAFYKKATLVRNLIKEDFEKSFEKCDVIISPTTPSYAFKIGEKANDPLNMYLSDIFTIPVNLAGIPAISVPSGFSEKGLPLGLQIMARNFDEASCFEFAYNFEKAQNF